MAERAGTHPAREIREVQQGALTRLFGRLSQALNWLLFALVFSIVLEWLGMVFWWPEEGLQHSRKMLAAEVGYLQMDFRRSLVSDDPARFAQTMADRAYRVLFEMTRLVDVIDWLARPPHTEESGLRVRLHRLYQPLAEFIFAALQITQVFALRVAILLLATPVFLLFGVVALVDGLVRRDLRRWGGGRESSFDFRWIDDAHAAFVDQIEPDNDQGCVVYQGRNHLNAPVAKGHLGISRAARNFAGCEGDD